MDKVIRYTAEDALASGEPGFWVRACDLDERNDQSKQREDALQGRLTGVEDIDSDLVVIVAVLEKRNAALEELLQDLVPLLESPDSPLFWEETMIERIHALTKPTAEACKFPQSCTTRCGCKPDSTADDDIPDFSPGNGNKARRRAAAIEALKPENQRVVPVPTDDPFSVCVGCFGSGTVSTGITEASSTICNKCNGTGREKA